VKNLPANRGHTAKTIALGPGDDLFVNIGSLSNSCQVADRQPRSLGQDPCLELESRAGIWRFSARRLRQTQADGEHYATGLRNVVALTMRSADSTLYGVQHGRDQLFANWPELYSERQSADLPSEEFVRIERGSDFGWPYCYHDWQQGKKVLAPEYGGDGGRVGRCNEKAAPLVAFPGHWAPNALLFYSATLFPSEYRSGAFIAFHGSWNRAPFPQEGYNVVFVPFANGRPMGEYSVFADEFRGRTATQPGADHRPGGLAVGPDGSLFIADDAGGRIWRVQYGAGIRR
jgi:glucose/arabinose dehydrogenase